ncbi:conserved Plasmodium protein, unknown function [Plasmodium ovale curtisi]|uniref:Uncharacterized protein n=1 Tax=Plasmodium ovale curtisi TaxID=864141 RepID=A0A1A8X202_PLAOA|nr:conserved Plasmodium protein, unknown function [Plasmodium ovale curtisi]SBS98616.1 conserved Plasmodium protein, unknown function [Plasmodium ovale curtisi]
MLRYSQSKSTRKGSRCCKNACSAPTCFLTTYGMSIHNHLLCKNVSLCHSYSWCRQLSHSINVTSSKWGLSKREFSNLGTENLLDGVRVRAYGERKNGEVTCLYMDRKNVSSSKFLRFIEKDKQLLLYTLCKIYRKGEHARESALKGLFHSIIGKIIEKESTLNVWEKLVYLSCVNSKENAEKINLTKGHKNVRSMDEKNVYNYFCTMLKNRKNNYIHDDEIVSDISQYLKRKINRKGVNSISMYLFNISYLNSKRIIGTNSLYFFSLYMLNYAKNKIKKRINIINISNYIELLTSIMSISKLKIERSNTLVDNDIETLNTMSVMNRNEYPFDYVSLSNMSHQYTSLNGNNSSHMRYSFMGLSHNGDHFFHYFNVYHFVYEEERVMNMKRDRREEEMEDADDVEERNEENTTRVYNMHHQTVDVINFTNYILLCVLKKCLRNCKKGIRSKQFAENVRSKIYLLISYMFNCLSFDIFCKPLFQVVEHMLVRMCPRVSGGGNVDGSEGILFRALFPSGAVQLLHLLSLGHGSTPVGKNGTWVLLKMCLEALFIDDCKSLGKRDKVILYISLSKLTFTSKRSYIEKLNNTISSELINFTHRDLYSIVYAISCSKFCDLSFFEALIRSIYKMKHKYTRNRLITMASIFYSFNLNMSILNLLLSYASRDSAADVWKSTEKPVPESDSKKSARKLEEDLENKERILKELSAHIKESQSEDTFTFTESDMLELNQEDNAFGCGQPVDR